MIDEVGVKPFTATGYLELKEECEPLTDHISLCDDDGMPFCLTGLLPLVGRGVRITVELEPGLEAEVSDKGNEPYVYQQTGMTPSAYTTERQEMQRAARHVFQAGLFKTYIGQPLTSECSRCEQLPDHPIHIKEQSQ